LAGGWLVKATNAPQDEVLTKHLTKIISLIKKTCPECGSELEGHLEYRGNGQSEYVSYCLICGATIT